MAHDYICRYRPPGYATVPEGFTVIEIPGHRFGGVRYTAPLSDAQLDAYELAPMDRRHPRNMAERFDRYRDALMAELSSLEDGGTEGANWAGRPYRVRLDSNATDLPFQLVRVSADGSCESVGAFNDFDDLAAAAWAEEIRIPGASMLDYPDRFCLEPLAPAAGLADLPDPTDLPDPADLPSNAPSP